MKSKLFGGYVHDWVQSSISNLRFGGTHSGCEGDMSVPMTSASAWMSAKSLDQSMVRNFEYHN